MMTKTKTPTRPIHPACSACRWAADHEGPCPGVVPGRCVWPECYKEQIMTNTDDHYPPSDDEIIKDPRNQLAVAFELAEKAEREREQEKERRVAYQDAVYAICLIVDKATGTGVRQGDPCLWKDCPTRVGVIIAERDEAQAACAAAQTLLRECWQDIFSTARVSQANLTGIELNSPDDPPCESRIGTFSVHQAGVDESLRLVKKVQRFCGEPNPGQPLLDRLTAAEAQNADLRAACGFAKSQIKKGAGKKALPILRHALATDAVLAGLDKLRKDKNDG